VKRKTLAERTAERANPKPEEALERDRIVRNLRVKVSQAESKYHAAVNRVERLETQIETLTKLAARKPVRVPSKPTRKRDADGTAVLVLSDWHVEELVQPERVNGLNEFTLEIAAQRIANTFDRALLLLEDARHLSRIDEMVVAVLGDLISGYIHEELQEGNQLAPLPATMFAADCLEAGLRKLLAHGKLSRIVVPACFGNHGRTTPRRRVATGADNSFERNLYLHLARRFRDDLQVQWNIAEGYHNWLEIQGRQVRFHHGDAIRYWGGVGGISIPINKAIAAWNKSRRADLDIFGHLHQWLWGWNWLCNGSLIGYAPFSVEIKADYQPPLQSFCVIDRDRGLVRALPLFVA